ncbi:MAG: hypothetical protein SRB2_04673 [Desulfobacteraceae bacterium Eth-SRB2]|nr:MAG: hypothetical protein SRB2_04673 [Desulfobacteraceae bacterium Eth-SRB2]
MGQPFHWADILTQNETGRYCHKKNKHFFIIKFFNFQSLLDNATKRKGKPVEKRGRKATGLKLQSQDSRAAEYL